MSKRGIIFILVGILSLLVSAGCRGTAGQAENVTAVSAGGTTTGVSAEMLSIADVITGDSTPTAPASAAAALAVNATSEPVTKPAPDTSGSVTIALNGDSIAVEGDGVTVDGRTATITTAGIYTLSGTLNDGQLIVDTEDEAPIYLILNGVDLRSATSAPLALMNSEQVVIVLADNSANYIEDAASYVFLDVEAEEPSAALFSNDDLTITGNGSLAITGNYNDGISSDDGIIIESGNIMVTAVDDGIRGKDFLAIEDGVLTVNAGDDGLKSDNEDDAELGYIVVEGGAIIVTAGGDAITAQTDVLITGGTFALTSGGGSGEQVAADASAKGIKGLANIAIDSGTFTIDAADDAIHSNSNIVINDGSFALRTGDDGIHADATVTINGGEIDISQSWEGIESAVITINDGNISVVSSDDGINVAGGVDGSGMVAGPGRVGRGGPGGMTGGESSVYTGDYYLYINGGTILVDAAGDGLDANGAIEMTGGLVIVNGPTEQMNGALDYDGTFNIFGGTFIAAGSAGMAQAPGTGSTQNSVLINLSGTLPGSTLLNIQDESGTDVMTFVPSKQYQSIVFSSPELMTGSEYTLYYGGSATGTETGGLYVDGTYSPGTEYITFTVSSVTTIIGGGFR